MKSLNSLPIFLSASVPQQLIGTTKAQNMFDLLVALIGGIFSHSGKLIFGGHPSITPLIHRIACLTDMKRPQVHLFQLNRFREYAPGEAFDNQVFEEITWVGSYENTLEEDLSQMRSAMVEISQAGVFIGGKTADYSGKLPGIRDEYEKFIQYHPKSPTYVIGMFGGETLDIIKKTSFDDNYNSNSLNFEEKNVLYYSDNIDLISSIIVADLLKHFDNA